MLRRLAAATLLATLALAPSQARAQTEYAVTIGRLQYDGGGDWYGDPESLKELAQFVRQEAGLDIAPEEQVVELTTDKLFGLPYLYMTGHGNVEFSTGEALRLRRYLEGGGFLHIDDNYGLDEHIRPALDLVFPDRDLVELPFSHPVYSSHFSFPGGLPKIHEHDGKPAQGFGILDDAGRLMVFYSYETDLGDGWEPEAVHGNPPEKRRAALQMGTNLVVYALMH